MPENILPSSPVLNPVDTMDVPIASPAPKKFPLLITILIIILTLLATLAIYLFLQVRTMALNNPNSSPSPISSPIPSPDSTSAWQTYQSDEHQISFKYPANYELTESKNYVSIISPLLTATKGYELKDGELKMEIYFNPSPKGDSLEKWASELMQPGATKMNDTIIGGQSATHLQFGTTGGDVYLLLKNNSRYQIAKYPVVTSRQSEFDQILSTFEFTNQPTTSDIKPVRKMGYIKSIKPNYDSYLMDIDYIDWITDDSQPNGYKIDNPTIETVSLPTELNIPTGSSITMQTYSYRDDGNFAFNQKITFSQLLTAFETKPEIWTNTPFWIETSGGTIIKIIEQYRP